MSETQDQDSAVVLILTGQRVGEAVAALPGLLKSAGFCVTVWEETKAFVVKTAAMTDVLACGNVRIYRGSRAVMVGGTEVPLSCVAFDSLALLASDPGQIFSRQQILASYTRCKGANERSVDVRILTLRRKLEAAGATARIVTVRGHGYKLVGPA
jgi:DNA-binding response OmpR family regulator